MAPWAFRKRQCKAWIVPESSEGSVKVPKSPKPSTDSDEDADERKARKGRNKERTKKRKKLAAQPKTVLGPGVQVVRELPSVKVPDYPSVAGFDKWRRAVWLEVKACAAKAGKSAAKKARKVAAAAALASGKKACFDFQVNGCLRGADCTYGHFADPEALKRAQSQT